MCKAAGLKSKSASPSAFTVATCIAIEELEAWFFGDIPALTAAYPGVPSTLAAQAPYRDPEKISGGTWEALERVLQRVGYFSGGLAKIAAARAIAAHMDVDRNRSPSFRHFVQTMRAL